MAVDYDVTQGPGGRLFVLLHRGCKVSREEILALLEEAGFDPSKVTFLEVSEDLDCSGFGAASVIIPVDDESGDLPELDQAGRCSGHVVVLLGPGCSFEGLHPLADKYGRQCGWTPEQLRDCLSSEGDFVRDATGAPADRPKVFEVKCRRKR